MNRLFRGFALSLAAGSFAISVPGVAWAQILETETARPLGKGTLEVGTNFEYQTSSEGHESALPMAVEYGFTDRFELLLEPVAYTAIRPKTGQRATGVGDLELTGTYLVRRESGGTPALALAGEVKFPTANNSLIGTGKTDFAGYLIASKRLGRFDTHANIGYTIVGRPAGVQLNNIFNFALASEMSLGTNAELFGEILGNTASSSSPEPTGPVPPGTITPEAPSGEIVGTIGLAKYVLPALRLSMGLSVDNNSAVMFRPGLTLRRR
ncbi:MAG TPA: transporter [Gemmatimonadales bacterium]|nr:transporter [Gemmatimonadales bacterium]